MASEKREQWTRKYHPTQLSDVVGHVRAIRMLRDWLRDFQLPTGTAEPIVFLYGTSGIGKTTIANLLLQQANYHIFEMNAGEIRSKKRIQEIMDKILANYSCSCMMKRKSRQQIIGIVMDEIDGMSCGDKGGLHQLFNMIQQQYEKKQVVNPVICISNRSYDKKIGSHLFREISLRKPSASDIARRLHEICKCEHVQIDDDALQILIHYTNQDIRKTLNFLQEVTFFFGPAHHIVLEDIEKLKTITRRTHIDYNIFDVTNTLFSRRYEFDEIYDLYKIDANLIPMMIHENLPSRLQHKRIPARFTLPMYQYLMHHLTLSDVLLSTQRWELSYGSSMLSCGYTNEYLGSALPKSVVAPKTHFTNTLTKSATQSNTKNFLAQISHKLHIDMRYFPYVFPLILKALTDQPETAPMYGLTYSEVEKIVQIYQKWQAFGTKPEQSTAATTAPSSGESAAAPSSGESAAAPSSGESAAAHTPFPSEPPAAQCIRVTSKHKKIWKRALQK